MAKRSTYKRVTGAVSRAAKTVAKKAKHAARKVMPKKKKRKAKKQRGNRGASKDHIRPDDVVTHRRRHVQVTCGLPGRTYDFW